MYCKKLIWTTCITLAASVAVAQERVDITSFEESFEWTWGVGNAETFVDFVEPPIDGETALVVFYDNAGSEWQHGTMSFQIDPVDLTGMREIRMSVYFTEGSTGQLRIRLDLPGGNILGFGEIPQDENGDYLLGEWHEISFPIDRLSSQNSVSDIGFIQGFIVPTPGDASGEVWIDNIYAIRSADIEDVEEIVLYDFEELDSSTGSVMGWQPLDGLDALLGEGEVEPFSGNNYMTFFASDGYAASNVATLNAKADFDNWQNAREILFEIRIPEGPPGGWIQSRLTIVSGIEGDDTTEVTSETREIGFTDAIDEWRTFLYEFDVTPHLDHINDPNGFFRVGISTNNDASALDFPVFVDNFRVAVVAGSSGGGSPVSSWSLY